jgi:AraC-like DNA-binding protein
MSRFRLTGVSGLGPLARVCESVGDGVLDRVLRGAGVPASLIASPDAMIPLQAMYAVFGESARAAGDELFGLRVGEAMHPADFGIWVRYALAARTAREMIRRTAGTVDYHQPGATLSLTETDGVAIFRYHAAERRGEGRAVHADHVLGPMLAAMRVFAGPTWLPEAFHLPYARPPHWRRLEDRLGAPAVFESSGAGLAFPAGLLDIVAEAGLPRPPITLADVRRRMVGRRPTTTAGAVASLVTFSPEGDGASLPTIAALLGRSPRALQAELQLEGTTFRDVVARLRLARARCLLRETSMSVSEIAWTLGYSELPHFTRAFTRGTGMPPSLFRTRATSAIRLLPAAGELSEAAP